MAADPEFVRRTEAGWEDIEAGRVVRIGETLIGVLAHPCNIYKK
jgi:hypothetical protein